jgi:site-specific recombinase XerD
MRVRDYYPQGKRYWIRLHEKGEKFHEVPVHHTAEEYLDEYIEAAGITEEKSIPLFRSTWCRSRELTERAVSRFDVYKMIQRLAEDAGISSEIACHSFRATGISEYLRNGRTIEHAQQIAATRRRGQRSSTTGRVT